MKKLICDVFAKNTEKVTSSLKKHFSPIVKKYNKVIAYNNCKICDVGGLKLTSSGENLSGKDVSKLIGIFNNGILDPISEGLHKTYSAILDKASANNFDFKVLQYLGLFEQDTGLRSGNLAQLPASQVFGAIIDTSEPKDVHAQDAEGFLTGYREYYTSFNPIEITNSTGNTFFTAGTLDTDTSKSFTINRAVVAYLVRGHGTLSCLNTDEDNNSSEKFNDLVNFVKKDLIDSLNTHFIYNGCYIKNKPMEFRNLGEKYIDKIHIHCETLGGTMKPVRDIIENICQKPDITLAMHPLVSITCENYKDAIMFDSKGNIIGSNTMTDAFNNEMSMHNEL